MASAGRPLRMLLTAVGSVGDVVPRLALAQELRRRGHAPTIACAGRHRGLVEGHGLAWVALGDHPPAAVSASAYRRMAEEPDPGRRGELLLEDLLVPMLPGLRRRLEHLVRGFDLLVLNDLLASFARAPIIDSLPVAIALTAQPVGGLALMVGDSPGTKLVGSSPLLLPPDHGLDSSFVVTDFWLPEASQRFVPDPGLDGFLSATGRDRRPVVAVTLGSAWGTEPRLSVAVLAAAAGRAGVSLVVQAGGAGDRTAPVGLDAISIGPVPYNWLFERVDAVVHHGGAGTLAEALRAGRPSVVIPHYGDHLYWALRLDAVGVSAGTLVGAELDEVPLANHIDRAVRDDALRARTADVGAGLDIAGGVRRACDCFEALAGQAGAAYDPGDDARGG
jgi:UDP:flavonoid glycosyltransferase YjiC (YdhE family)